MPRPRLLQRLAARWERRLVTLVAGPGFGKTVLLAGAVGDRQERAPARRDVWLTCEPADESAEHLLGGLTAALGATSGTSLEDLCDGVWSAAPLSICFILDDVHEIPPRSAGAAVLRNLLVELPANGHVVLASRDPVPVPLSRLAASGQLDRLTEGDLVLDPSELAAFAVARDVDPALLASTGGWPALAELTVTAGEDLVLDYLWEEVLGRVGDERTRLLAAFSIVGGGDDEIVTALAGRPYRADDLIADVPLVARTHEGWATLHPLWRPALRAILSEQETTHVQQRAAAVHLERGRHSMAIDVLADAGDWDGVLAVVRAAALEPGALLPSSEFGRWVRLLPREWRGRPEAELAAGIDRRARSPLDALPSFEAAACGFRARGDVDGEVAAIGHDGAVRWTANDFGGVLALYQRVQELAVAEVRSAQELAAVGQAAMAHIGADSAGVLDALRGVGDSMTTGWLPVVHWFRSVAHRRMGHLQRAYDELDAAHLLPDTELDMRLQLEVAACVRTGWRAVSSTSSTLYRRSTLTSSTPAIGSSQPKPLSSWPPRRGSWARWKPVAGCSTPSSRSWPTCQVPSPASSRRSLR